MYSQKRKLFSSECQNQVTLLPRMLMHARFSCRTFSDKPSPSSSNTRPLCGFIVVLVGSPCRCKPSAITGDEVPCPQAAKSLVANDVRVGVEVGHDLLEVGSSFLERGVPEPEL